MRESIFLQYINKVISTAEIFALLRISLNLSLKIHKNFQNECNLELYFSSYFQTP